MDVSSFMGGNYLTVNDLPPQPQIWTIRGVSQQQVGTDTKVCLQFDQHAKPLGANKTNLRAIAAAYGVDSGNWIGRPLELYRDQTQFQGKVVPCVRVRAPQQQQFVQQPVQAAPVAVQPQQFAPQPVAVQPAAPWEIDDQRNNPRSA